MLTGRLLDHSRRNGVLSPRFVDPAKPGHLALAEALLGLLATQVGRPRGEVEAALGELGAPDVPARLAPGLVHLLLRRCTFEVSAATDPQLLRAGIFDAAAPAWGGQAASRDAGAAAYIPPPASLAELPAWRERVLRAAGGGLGLSPAAAEAQLFADLPDNQRLQELRPITAEGLLYRYNVAQVQGLLLQAERLTLTAPWPPVTRLRQLMRYLKFFGLLYSLRREGDALQLTADGPLSLLGATGRYGMNLAQFFPALLLWPDNWRLTASVRLRPGQPTAELTVQPHPWLRSHYPDQGQWVPEELAAFIDGMATRGQGWQAEPAAELLPLPDNRFLIPDVVLRHPGDGRRFFLEYLPYPSRERVEERGRLLAAYTGGDYLVACRHVPALDELVAQCPWLVAFRRTLLPSVVVRHLAALPPQAGAQARP